MIKPFIWSIIDTYFGFFIKFVFIIIITRILTPYDYGLIAYTSIFIGIAALLSEGGFGMALIQKTNPTEIDYSTAYIFNIAISFIFFIVYFIISPFVANFFMEDPLLWILRITSLNLLFNSICYIHTIRLMKKLDFKKQATINLISSILSGSIGLICALSGLSYWSLIIQTLAGSIFRMIGYLVFERWKPTFQFSKSSFLEQFNFGGIMLLQGLLQTGFREIYSLVIGKNYNTISLGFYNRGYKFYELFIVKTSLAVNKVTFPLLSSNHDNKEWVNNTYNKIYGLLFLIMAPLSLSLILLSKPIIYIVLTSKWVEAVPFMQLFFISGFLFILIHFNSILLISTKRQNQFLIFDVIHKGLLIIALFLTFRNSINAIIIGWLIAYFIFYIIYEIHIYKIGFGNLHKYVILLQIVTALLPILVVDYITNLTIDNNLFLILIKSILFPSVYILVLKWSSPSMYKVFSEVIVNRLKSRITKNTSDISN